MKTIYIGHSRNFDYEHELYEPVSELQLDENIRIILPHDEEGEYIKTKELFQNGCDLFIAEVSYPATGLGMELAYADVFKVPIVCFYKTGSKISNSIKNVTERFVEYSDREDLKRKILVEINC